MQTCATIVYGFKGLLLHFTCNYEFGENHTEKVARKLWASLYFGARGICGSFFLFLIYLSSYSIVCLGAKAHVEVREWLAKITGPWDQTQVIRLAKMTRTFTHWAVLTAVFTYSVISKEWDENFFCSLFMPMGNDEPESIVSTCREFHLT